MKKKVGTDPNFSTVLNLVNKIKSDNKLHLGYKPNALEVARLIKVINPILIQGQDLRKVKKSKLKSRIKVIAFMAAVTHEVTDFRKNNFNSLKKTALLLWWGCLACAKTIAYKTRSGVNKKNQRTTQFEKLDKAAKANNIIKQGIQAGPYFKMLLKQKYYFDGIPQPIIDKYFGSVSAAVRQAMPQTRSG